MKYIFTLCLLFAIITVVYCANLEQDWKTFKSKYKKNYRGPEEKKRKGIFQAKWNKIQAHNKKYQAQKGQKNAQIKYKMGINEFSDLSHAEIRSKFTSKVKRQKICKKKRTGRRNVREEFRTNTYHDPIKNHGPIPKEKDWRDKVGPAVHQGTCGCCWAYATAATMEGHLAIQKIKHGKLSEQQLVDCVRTEDTDGCNGGLHTEALDYVKAFGLGEILEYPKSKKNEQETCKDKKKVKHPFKITGQRELLDPDEAELQKIIAFIGPVAASVAVPDSFSSYDGTGVYNDPECKAENIEHNIAIFGYGEDKDGGAYWLIRNSWGPKWGLNGYIKIARNANNLCGIAVEAAYPVFK